MKNWQHKNHILIIYAHGSMLFVVVCESSIKFSTPSYTVMRDLLLKNRKISKWSLLLPELTDWGGRGWVTYAVSRQYLMMTRLTKSSQTGHKSDCGKWLRKLLWKLLQYRTYEKNTHWSWRLGRRCPRGKNPWNSIVMWGSTDYFPGEGD